MPHPHTTTAISAQRTANSAPARGLIQLNAAICKGCGLCVEACPPKVLQLTPQINRSGYHSAQYLGENCTGCGICFYVCPEPGAITVLRLAA